MRATKLIAGLFGAVLVLSVGAAFATDTFELGGWEFTCSDMCIIVIGPDGSITVTDVNGGPVKVRIKPKNVFLQE